MIKISVKIKDDKYLEIEIVYRKQKNCPSQIDAGITDRR
jgi:hypothetical protein